MNKSDTWQEDIATIPILKLLKKNGNVYFPSAINNSIERATSNILAEPLVLSRDVIKNVLLEAMEVEIEELQGKCRKQNLVMKRQFFFFFMVIIFPRIGQKNLAFMLSRDHATVIHSLRIVSDYLKTKDDMYYQQWRKIMYQLQLKKLVKYDFVISRMDEISTRYH